MAVLILLSGKDKIEEAGLCLSTGTVPLARHIGIVSWPDWVVGLFSGEMIGTFSISHADRLHECGPRKCKLAHLGQESLDVGATRRIKS